MRPGLPLPSLTPLTLLLCLLQEQLVQFRIINGEPESERGEETLE